MKVITIYKLSGAEEDFQRHGIEDKVENLKMLKLDLNSLQNQNATAYKELKKCRTERVKHGTSNFTIFVSVHTCF